MKFVTWMTGALLVSVALFPGVRAEVLINEIDIYEERIELWNRGDAQNMTGWRLEMVHQYTGGTLDTFTYAFEPGFTVPADGMVLVIDEDEDDAGPLLYLGSHVGYFNEFSLALYDDGGAVVDYMDTYGFAPEPPDSGAWTGYGVTRGSVRYMYRDQDDDTDTRADWYSSTSSAGGTLMDPNPGQAERRYAPDRYANLVVNEVALYYSGMYTYLDHVELWNRGDSLDMTGWRVKVGTNDFFEFPDGYVIAPGRLITLQRYSPYNDTALALGFYDYRGWVALLDPDSVLVDYFYSYAYSGPADEGWYGGSPVIGEIGAQRIRDKDTDTPYDWGEMDVKTDEGKINPGQHHAPRLQASPVSYAVALDTQLSHTDTLRITNTGLGTLGLALTANVRSSSGDTSAGWRWLSVGRSSGSLAAGGELAVPVTFDRTGEAAGTYYADITVAHDMRDGGTEYVIPCTLTVAPVNLVSIPDSVAYGTVIAGGIDTAYVPVVNPGTEATTVDSFVSDDAAFSVAYAVPFTVAPYGTVYVPVVYEPAAAGSHTGVLTVCSDAGNAAVDLSGTGIDGPALSVSATEITAAVDSGDTFATSFTLTNTGSGTLNVAGYYDDRPVVINEIRNGTWVEFRNRGPEISLAGWQLKWTQTNSPDDPEYTRTFTFPDTAVIPADGYIGVSDYEYYATGVFLYMNGPDFYGWITSYALLDSSGNVVDYLERDIMGVGRPAGARWYGPGLEFTSAYLTRPGDRDTDTRSDWKCMGEYDVTKGRLNNGQSAGYRTSWLTLSRAVDTVLAAGASMAVGVTLDARNAADGRYEDLLRLENDGARPGTALPVAMNVGPQRYLAAFSGEVTFPDAFPNGESYDTLYLHNPGTDTVTVTEVDPYYDSFFRCGLSFPAYVAGGETIAVPLSFTPDYREYTWYTDDAFVYSDAVNAPAIRLFLRGTAAKAAPVITSLPVTQAVEDVPYSYVVTAADAEPLDTVAYSLATAPAGMVIDSASGRITWTPDDGQTGWNAVAVRASDGVYHDEQAFGIFVAAVNGAPVIVPVGTDTAYTQRGYSRYVNASDEDDPALTYSFDTAPAGMTVSAAGLMEWTPDTLFRDSTVTVAYRVSDGDTSVADTFGLHVRDLRLLRLGADTVYCDPASMGGGYDDQYFALYNDGQHRTTVSSVTFGNPDFSLLNPPPFSVSGGYYSGRYLRFRPTAMGTVYADVTIYSDAMDHPVLRFVARGVGLNTAPRITSAPVTTATEDAPYAYRMTAEDDEVDTALVCSLVTAPAGMSVNDTGLVTWTPVDAQYGDNPVVLIVTDGFLADTQSFVISVARVNDPPVLAYEPVYDTAYYGVPYSYAIPATDEEGDSLLYALTSPPTGMRVTDAGEIIWLAPISAVGTWTPVIYSVSDGDSAVSSSYMLYTANEQRLLGASADTLYFPYTPVGSTSQCTLLLVNAGTANTDVTTLQVTSGVFSSSVSAPFTVDAGAAEAVVLTYTPALPQEDAGSVTILSDAVDRPNITVALRASSARHAPHFISIPDTTAVEDSAYTYRAVAVDADPGDTLRYGLAGHPQGLVIDPVTGLVTWLPENDDAGDWTVIIRVTDGHFDVDQEYTLHTAPVNDPPVITPGPAVDTTLEFDNYILFTAVTDEEDDSLRFGFADSLPGMTIDGTGMIHWEVPNGYGGFTYPVTYTVSDGEHTVQASFLLVVLESDVNAPPVITPGPAADTTDDGSSYSFSITASDADDDSLIYGLAAAPAGMTVDADGVIRWDVPADAGGSTVPVTYTVSDGEATVQADFDLYVREVSGIAPFTGPGTDVTVALGGNPAGSVVRFVLDLRAAADVRCDVYALDGTRVFASAGKYDAGAAEFLWKTEAAAGLHYYVVTIGDAVAGGTVIIVE